MFKVWIYSIKTNCIYFRFNTNNSYNWTNYIICSAPSNTIHHWPRLIWETIRTEAIAFSAINILQIAFPFHTPFSRKGRHLLRQIADLQPDTQLGTLPSNSVGFKSFKRQPRCYKVHYIDDTYCWKLSRRCVYFARVIDNSNINCA